MGWSTSGRSRAAAVAGDGDGCREPGGQSGNEDNVTICHRTNSVSNPYVVITVDPSAVDGDLGNNKGVATTTRSTVGRSSTPRRSTRRP